MDEQRETEALRVLGIDRSLPKLARLIDSAFAREEFTLVPGAKKVLDVIGREQMELVASPRGDVDSPLGRTWLARKLVQTGHASDPTEPSRVVPLVADSIFALRRHDDPNGGDPWGVDVIGPVLVVDRDGKAVPVEPAK
jgi:hypothetical protein